MPPNQSSPAFTFTFLQSGRRAAKYLLFAAAIALTGCATTGTQTALKNDRAHLEEEEELFADYEFETESDPLSTYLANRARSDITIASAEARRQARKESARNAAAQKENIASTALSFLGVKYRFGGDTPGSGFDCSGLVSYAAEKSLGLKLPRQSQAIAKEGVSIKRDELRQGDLVFFNTRGARFSHVGIYLGEGKFVHAPRTGSVVRVESMHTTYWQKRYNGARRLAAVSSSDQASSPRLRSVR